MSKTFTTGFPKEPYELEDCPIDSRIILVYHSGEEYHGIFRGMDGDDTIMLRSEGKNAHTMGFVYETLNFWLLKD